MSGGTALVNNDDHKDPLERWYTSEKDADRCWAILAALGMAKSVEHLFDPCCGDHAFEDAFPHREQYTGYDLDKKVHDEKTTYRLVRSNTDFLRARVPKGVTHIVSNPPYSLAEQFVERCRTKAPEALLAFLLPMGYLGTIGRTDRVHRTHRPSHIVNMGRLKFEGPALEMRLAAGKKATGAQMDYALVIWDGHNTGPVKYIWERHLCAPAPLFGGPV